MTEAERHCGTCAEQTDHKTTCIFLAIYHWESGIFADMTKRYCCPLWKAKRKGETNDHD